MRRSTSPIIAIICALACALSPLVPAALSAQQSSSSSVTPQGEAKTDPGVKRVLGFHDIGRWKRINAAALSPDGAWMTYTYAPNEGDDTLFVRQLEGSTLYTIPLGSAPQFSDDSRYAGYFVSPASGRGGRGGRGAGGGGRGRGGAPAADAAPGAGARRFELLELATGTKYDVPEGQTFKFSKGSHWVAVHTTKANPSAKNDGADLVLRELSTGITRNIGNVNLYDFDDAGAALAYTVDAADEVGNGVYVVDLTTNASTVLNSAAANYDQLAWSEKGTSLAVLRGDVKKGDLLRDNTLLVWSDAASATPRAAEYDPSADASFPKGYVVSEYAPLRWARDGSRVFLGIKAQEPAPVIDPNAEPKADVDVWHWKDAELQSVQIVRLAQEKRATLAAAYDVADRKFVPLADSTMRNVTPTPDPRWAIGRVDTTYRGAVEWGGAREDYYRVNTASGEKTLIADSLVRTMGSSPDGRWFLYLQHGRVYAYDVPAGRAVPLDAGDAKLSFVNQEDDYPYEKPAYGVAGWSKDGKSVILDHKYDVYALPLDGGKAVNLTGGMGDAQKIVFRIVRLDRPAAGGRGGRGGGGAAAGGDEDTGIDLSQPLLLSAYGDLTKKSGYYTLAPGAKPAPLIYDDESIGGAVKAEHADRVIFTRQTYKEFPDYWTTNAEFASPRKVTDADPFIDEYKWASKKVLVDFTNSRGLKLQGTLTYPADYQPGKKYPMLVYFYERLTNTMNQFAMPIFDDRPHFAEYASDGYFIFEPDIQYEVGKPGTSALDCVTSGVKKVLSMGDVDPKRVGLQGHSWGGYQTSFILTQTDMFATIVTGAPPTDLLSFYDELYKSSGTVQQGITEIGQVRMGAGNTPWTAPELYRSQSPIEHVQNIKTPFLILQGTSDGAVDWDQGLELYNAARRWGKTVVFLSYPGEQHHLTRKENQKDFQVRMKQWFDHYLKGTPEPKWMADGVPQTQKGGAIQ